MTAPRPADTAFRPAVARAAAAVTALRARIAAQHAAGAPGVQTCGLAAELFDDIVREVWRALLEIPNGALSTYRRLATAIGKPGAARAVGTAVGSNPVAFLIPCHRVIRETGAISGYRWGVGRKRALLAWEGAGGAGKE